MRTNYFLLLIIGVIFLLPNDMIAQSDWQPLISDQQQFQKRAMLVLGGWGAANILTGGIGIATSEGTAKHFHQMNLGWGAINTGLAIAGYLGARSFDLDEPIGMSLLNKNLGMSKAFLFNAGLDVGYVAGGLYLRERSKNASKHQERLKGFGNSIVVQGAFLFTFDLVAYFLNNQRTSEIQDMILNVGAKDGGVGLLINF